MTDMIERVARAICRAGGKDPDETMIELGGVRTPMWDAFVPIARAAIEAMREPTEAMLDAAEAADTHGNNYSYNSDNSDYVTYADPINYWYAMIDAALNPLGEPK